MSKGSVFDQLIRAFGDAVTDMREKVVEEPWFGRATSQPQPHQQSTFDAMTGGVSPPAMDAQAHLPPREHAPLARPGTKAFDAYVTQIKEGDRIASGLTEPTFTGRSKFDALTEQYQRLQGHEPEKSLDRDQDHER